MKTFANAHKHLWAFIGSILCLYFVFPHIPGITFTGSLGDAFLVNLGRLALTIVIIISGTISLLIAGIVYAVKTDRKLPKKSVMTAWMLSHGYWQFSIGAWIVSIVLSSIIWKITAACTSTLQIDGWLPILIGSAIVAGVNFLPLYFANPSKYGEAAFRKTLEETLAKEKAEEEKENQNR